MKAIAIRESVWEVVFDITSGREASNALQIMQLVLIIGRPMRRLMTGVKPQSSAITPVMKCKQFNYITVIIL